MWDPLAVRPRPEMRVRAVGSPGARVRGLSAPGTAAGTEESLYEELKASLREQEAAFRTTLILNPVENIPFAADIEPASGFLHGLYNTDKVRTPEERAQTVHQFAGRDRIAVDSRRIYGAWADALGAADLSMRLLSGLHAHAVLFMALAKAGESVVLLPVIGGGHMSTKAILERLGLDVIDMPIDLEGRRVDVGATRKLLRSRRPDYVFVDRSEGLNYEDFSEILEGYRGVSIFDASQYLSNVLAGDHTNPFAMGFDLVVSTLHKNFPGPQKALVATRQKTDSWSRLLSGISTYVSNMHSYGTYTAGLSLERRGWIGWYSHTMLLNATLLEDHLAASGVDVVRRRRDVPPTHHLWIRAEGQQAAFGMFQDLEACGFLTNFRKLPYELGFGLRLGLNAATRTGLTPDRVPRLADLIAEALREGASSHLTRRCRAFVKAAWDGFEG